MSRRVALYTRVSSRDQTSALQIDGCGERIARAGWTLAEHFAEEAITSQRVRRPELDRLMAATRKRRFDVLLVWKSDRIFRSVLHMVTTLAELDALGVDFVSCTESFDTTTPQGRLLFHVCSAVAQFERDLIVERTIAGMAAARKRGAQIGRPRTRVDVEAARELVAANLSRRAIARELGVSFGALTRALGRE
jgi:DNA invertase Pin-like site-specific DNA recombinase